MQKYFKNILVILGIAFLLSPALGQVAPGTCDTTSQLCNVEVLIEQYQIIDKTPSQTTTLNNIIQQSPDLTQLHLRIWGDLNINQGGGNAQLVAQQINNVQLPKTKKGAVLLGFHPDNDKSASTWSCNFNNANCSKCNDLADYFSQSVCVFQSSIQLMNQVNSNLKQMGSPNQFAIFSTEQSYYEAAPLPADYPGGKIPPKPTADQQAAALLKAVNEQKACLSSSVPDPTNPWCPNVKANPTVQYGVVGPSCMAAELYGNNGYDYGYPQMYNLVAQYNSPTPTSVFPLPSQFATSRNPQPYEVWDANLNLTNKHSSSILPSFLDNNPPYGTLTTANASIYSPPTGVLISNDSVAQILANIITTNFSLQNYALSYPCVDTKTNPGKNLPYPGKIFFTVSGEPYIYGNINQFKDLNSINSTLQKIYTYVNQTYVNLPKPASQSLTLNQWPVAIWSFDTMCLINSQVCVPAVDPQKRRHRM